MRIYRCPRCRAEDITSDAHPTRVVWGAEIVPLFVCRNCHRAAELEFRIAREAQGLPYEPLRIREALRRLAAFYRERVDERSDPALPPDDADREARLTPVRAALRDVERRLAVESVD